MVLPLVMLIMFGAIEVGTYFYYEHLLLKSLRDGARYAARQDFSTYTCNAPVTSGTALTNTKSLVMTTLLSGGYDRLPAWNASTITMRVDCYTTAVTDAAVTQNMSGIYKNNAGGAPVVQVSATVPYVPITGTFFGFNPTGLQLRGTHQAAVMGI